MWEGKTFLSRVGEVVNAVCDEVWILGRAGMPVEKYQAEVPGARVRVDVQAQGGPVVALREALKQGRSDFVVVVPCDAPALRQEDLEQLVTAARQSKGPAVAVSGGSTLFDLFCAPRNLLEERLKKARRLEDVLAEAKLVVLGNDGLNVNEPRA